MGLLRLLLSLCVLFFHTGFYAHLLAPIDAGAAVHCFFILSGFYITLGLNERYHGSGSLLAFYVGRFFRLWPIYLLSLAILIPTGVLQQTFQSARQWPDPIYIWFLLSNLFIFGLDGFLHLSLRNGHVILSEFGLDPNHNGISLIINLPAWSLAVECVFYAAAPFFVRNFRRLLTIFFIALAYCLWIRYAAPQETATRVRLDSYYPFYVTFFGLGGIAYWIRRVGSLDVRKHYLLFACICVLTILAQLPSGSIIYLGVAVTCGWLFELTKTSRFDKFLGELSYPIYVLQIPACTWLRSVYPSPSPLENVCFVLMVAVLAYIVIDIPVERFRKTLTRRIMTRSAADKANCPGEAVISGPNGHP